ncbi:DegT/DnrJ/EryC1/StrS family aminotransferase [Streptomyces sp. NPDC002870]|uniref:DegT/DnrJ/EryC1/StrS family aminotransferase n=1 Tax=Streptomyces sp. NPDC002870 TaxID=3364666 RepID=UPI00367D381B
MLALGVKPGDEVTVADYTFPALAHAVRYVGAVPVFAGATPRADAEEGDRRDQSTGRDPLRRCPTR